MRNLFCLWIVFLTLTCFGDEGLPKQHISTANADNLAVAINPGQTHALVVGRRFLSTDPPLNISVGTIELVKLSNGLSDPAFHEALDVGGNILRPKEDLNNNGVLDPGEDANNNGRLDAEDPAPRDAGVIYVNASKGNSNTDCFSVAWVNDNEAWALCKQPTSNAQPLFLVRIRPNEAEKVKVYKSSIGVNNVTANKLYNNSGFNSLIVDGNYLVVGGRVGSNQTDTQGFLAKFLLSSVPQANSTTGAIADWAPETMVKYGLINYGLSGLAKATIDGSNYYLTLNRQADGRYFIGKHNSSDLSYSLLSDFSQVPVEDITKIKINGLITKDSGIYLYGSYEDRALVIALNGDGVINSRFNESSSTDAAGVLRIKPLDKTYQIKGADERIVFGNTQLTALRVTSTGALVGVGHVVYTAAMERDGRTVYDLPASVKYSDLATYYRGFILELDSVASSSPVKITPHIGPGYDFNNTMYSNGEVVDSRLVVIGQKLFFAEGAERKGAFYQSLTQGNSGYSPAPGVDSCLVVVPKKEFTPSELVKGFKLFVNGVEVTEPEGGALGYLNGIFADSNKIIGNRVFGRDAERGVTGFRAVDLTEADCQGDSCTRTKTGIRFSLGGMSAYRVECSILSKDERDTLTDHRCPKHSDGTENNSCKIDFTVKASTVPGAPTNVVGTRGDGQVSLTWTAPSSNGGSNITSYKVQYSANGGAFVDGPSSTTNSATVTGLSNGTSYVFRVAATNGVGIGPYSASLSLELPIATFTLTVNNLNTPNAITGGAVNCTGASCNYSLNNGSVVNLNAAIPPNTGYLINWTGCDSISGAQNNNCQVSMTRARSVTAEYLVPVYRKRNTTTGDYLFTLSAVEAPSYQNQGVAFYIYRSTNDSRIPLFRCLRNFPQGPDNFISQQTRCEGYTFLSRLGYVAALTSTQSPLLLRRYSDRQPKQSHFIRVGNASVPSGFILDGPLGSVAR